MLARSGAVLLTGALGAGLAASGDLGRQMDGPLGDYLLTMQGVKRIARTWFAAGRLAVLYKSAMAVEGIEARDAAMSDAHAKGVVIMRNLFRSNGGVYVKMGQHFAQLPYLLPDAYVEGMRCFLTDAPRSSFEDVKAVVEEDLGRPLADVFATVDEQPIASASLAQVHVATTHDGQRVALKVQHRGLRETSALDKAVICAAVRAAEFVFPRFPLGWLAAEMERNLPAELNFERESHNAARTRRLLAQRRDVRVPDVLFSSQRVLAMSFEEGVHIGDTAALSRLNLHLPAVASTLAAVFSQLTFVHGWVHSDPHEGNLLVRAQQDGSPLLVLLDHGLYRPLTDSFRADYAHLWYALITGDTAGMQRYGRAVGAGSLFRVLAGMMTAKTWDVLEKPSLERLRMAPSESEENAKIVASVVNYGEEIVRCLNRVDRTMLLLLKTADCLRAVDARLGAPNNSHITTARFCLHTIAEEKLKKRRGWRTKLSNAWRRAKLEIGITYWRRKQRKDMAKHNKMHSQ